jgi:tol-pal system protein YbgF
MAPRIVVNWVLILQVFWLGIFSVSSRYFVPPDLSHKKIEALEEKVHRSERLMANLEVRFSEYKDSVALAGIKVEDNTKWTDPRREIASVFADPSFKVIPVLQIKGNQKFEKGRDLFLSEDYSAASEVFESFISNYSENANLPQAAFLLSESYFEMGAEESAVKAIDLLITHYPESELAGYAMVRLGKIFDSKSRPEEASEIYNIVIAEYPKSNAAWLAKKGLKGLPL